jgi:hypothetical protein
LRLRGRPAEEGVVIRSRFAGEPDAYIDDGRIVAGSTSSLDLRQRDVDAQRRPVRVVGRHRFDGVRDREDARDEADGVAPQAAG